jgi:hypothetical protein
MVVPQYIFMIGGTIKSVSPVSVQDDYYAEQEEDDDNNGRCAGGRRLVRYDGDKTEHHHKVSAVEAAIVHAGNSSFFPIIDEKEEESGVGTRDVSYGTTTRSGRGYDNNFMNTKNYLNRPSPPPPSLWQKTILEEELDDEEAEDQQQYREANTSESSSDDSWMQLLEAWTPTPVDDMTIRLRASRATAIAVTSSSTSGNSSSGRSSSTRSSSSSQNKKTRRLGRRSVHGLWEEPEPPPPARVPRRPPPGRSKSTTKTKSTTSTTIRAVVAAAASVRTISDGTLTHIMTFLDLADLSRCQAVSKRWRAVGTIPILWHHVDATAYVQQVYAYYETKCLPQQQQDTTTTTLSWPPSSHRRSHQLMTVAMAQIATTHHLTMRLRPFVHVIRRLTLHDVEGRLSADHLYLPFDQLTHLTIANFDGLTDAHLRSLLYLAATFRGSGGGRMAYNSNKTAMTTTHHGVVVATPAASSSSKTLPLQCLQLEDCPQITGDCLMQVVRPFCPQLTCYTCRSTTMTIPTTTTTMTEKNDPADPRL